MTEPNKWRIEYFTLGRWKIWTTASSREKAEELVANRRNPTAICRIGQVAALRPNRSNG